MSDNKAQKQPSNSLALAAMAGLLGAASAACGSLPFNKKESKDNAAPTSNNSAAAPSITSKKNVPDMTFALFSDQCKARQGFVETHAACGGSGSCKGMSFNQYSKDLIEHSCKGGNTCAGMSCVDGPADTNLTGSDIYNKSCSDCHTPEAAMLADNTGFKVFVPKGGDKAKAEADFSKRSAATHISIVAFGTHGVNPSGTAYANMPAFYTKYSHADIERVVTYLRTLKPSAAEYSVQGEP